MFWCKEFWIPARVNELVCCAQAVRPLLLGLSIVCWLRFMPPRVIIQLLFSMHGNWTINLWTIKKIQIFQLNWKLFSQITWIWLSFIEKELLVAISVNAIGFLLKRNFQLLFFIEKFYQIKKFLLNKLLSNSEEVSSSQFIIVFIISTADYSFISKCNILSNKSFLINAIARVLKKLPAVLKNIFTFKLNGIIWSWWQFWFDVWTKWNSI